MWHTLSLSYADKIVWQLRVFRAFEQINILRFPSDSFIHYPLTYSILTTVAPPSTHPSLTPFLLPPIHHSFIYLQKRAGFPGILNQHRDTNYKKTSHIPLQQCWVRQLNRRKRVLSEGKRVRNNPTILIVRIFTRIPKYKIIAYMQRP